MLNPFFSPMTVPSPQPAISNQKGELGSLPKEICSLANDLQKKLDDSIEIVTN